MQTLRLILLVLVTLALGRAEPLDQTTFHVNVDLIVLELSVKNGRGEPVLGLSPQQIEIYENDVRQTLEYVRPAGRPATREPDSKANITTGTVFVLVDTSNRMYSRYVHAVDAIARFIRALEPGTAVAVYTFSRNVHRAVEPTMDRQKAIAGVYSATAGAKTALYDSLLLTLRDAAKVSGPKRVLVISNGADTGSILSPDDVIRVGEDEGIPISVLSTNYRDPISNAVFQRLTKNTGGHLRVPSRWQQQGQALASILSEFKNSYLVAYYSNNTSSSFRRISVQVRDEKHRKYQVHTRRGYHPPRPPASDKWSQAANETN